MTRSRRKPYNAAFFYTMASEQMRIYSELWKDRSETECLPIQAFYDIRTKLQDFVTVLEKLNNERKRSLTRTEQGEEMDFVGQRLAEELAKIREENGYDGASIVVSGDKAVKEEDPQ